jgi:hypothetical protein
MIQFTELIFNKDTLQILININPFLTFSILLIFFYKDNSEILKQHNRRLVDDLMLRNNKRKFDDPLDLLHTDPPIHNLIMDIISESIDHEDVDVKSCFHYFLSEVAKRGY